MRSYMHTCKYIHMTSTYCLCMIVPLRLQCIYNYFVSTSNTQFNALLVFFSFSCLLLLVFNFIILSLFIGDVNCPQVQSCAHRFSQCKIYIDSQYKWGIHNKPQCLSKIKDIITIHQYINTKTFFFPHKLI